MPKDTRTTDNLMVTIGQHSDAGRKPSNQDFHGALVPDASALALKGVALAIADGISSSPVSGIASETAVKSLLTDYYCTSDAWTVKTAASRVISATNSWLHTQNRRARLEDMDHGQVCTLSALILKGQTAHIFHIGDSRIWRISGDSLEPLTTDHRVILSSAESYLGRALGVEAQVEIDYQSIPVGVGDTFVLTTDGVHDHIEPSAITRGIRDATTLDQAAKDVVQTALSNGSEDNLTIQIVRVDRLPDADGFNAVADAEKLPIPAFPNAGTVIDGLRILRQIHSNSRSHIYLASAPDGTKVALKIPSVDQRGNPDYLRHFLMEEWIARRVSSAHVLKPGPAPDARTGLYILTEYVEGQTLRQWMTDHPKPTLDEVRDIVDQVIKGLRAFHRREMLHQDLRPENIMIDVDGTVKIIDFGSMRVAGVQETVPGAGDDAILGTLQYTAPEYFSGDVTSWRSDLFSLGVIVYEMLTGRLPYGTQVSKVRRRADLRRLTYRQARDETHPVPDWIDATLKRALHPDPLRRHDALSEFATALHIPEASAVVGRHTPLVDRDPVRFWKTVAAVLAVLVVFLIAQLAG